MNVNTRTGKIFILSAMLLASTLAYAGEKKADYSGKIQADVLLDTTTTQVGEPIVYPKGQARILSLKIVVPPGAETGWHTHGAPIWGYVVKGTLEVEYEGRGKKQFTVGEALVDALDVPHNGKAVGNQAVELIVVFASSEGTKVTIPHKH